MGCFVFQGTPCAKGPIPHWLDQSSTGEGARTRLAALLDAIKNLDSTYQGLETVFDTCLASAMCTDALLRPRLLDHLKDHWFNDGPDGYFPGQQVAQKYAEAVIKTLELSLNGKPDPVPINAWWIIHADNDVKMLTLAGVDSYGVTVSSSVTLLICTPMPPPSGAPTNRSLWGDAEAWVTEQQTGRVITRRIEKESR